MLNSEISETLQALILQLTHLQESQKSILENLSNFLSRMDEKLNFNEEKNETKQELIETASTYILELKNKNINISNSIDKIKEDLNSIVSPTESLEVMYQILFHESQDAIITIDYNGKYLTNNKIATSNLENQNESVLGKTLWDIQDHIVADEKYNYIKECIDKKIKIIQRLEFHGKLYLYHFHPLNDKTCMVVIYSSKRKIQNRLLKTERFLNDSQRITDLGSWEWNLKTNENKWSDHLYKIYGLDEKTTKPDIESFLKVLYPDDLKIIKEFSEKGVLTRMPQNFLFRIIRPDGEIRYLEAHEETIFNKKGEAVKVYGTNQDVTEKLNAEKKLISQQILLSNAEKISSMGSWSWNVDTNIITWSDNLCKIYDLEPGHELNTIEDYFSMIHPDDLDFSKEIISNSLINKKAFSLEFRIITKAGNMRILISYADIELNRNGEVIVIYGSNQDITDRKTTENLLIKSENSLKASQRIAHLGNWQYDIITGIVSGSDEIFNILGLEGKNKEGLIHDFYNFIHIDDKEKVTYALNEALKNGIPYNIDHRIIRPNGEIRYVNEQAEILYSSDGKPVSMLGTALDITDRKMAEITVNELLRESQSLNEELVVSEEQVRESLEKSLQLNETLRLKEAQLDEAQRIAKLGRWEYDIITQKIFWSEEIFNLMRIDPSSEAPTFEEYIEMVYPSDREIFIVAVNEAITESKEYSIEIRVARKDGSIIWTLGKGKPLIDIVGNVIKLIGINADISDKKFAEVALIESEKKYRMLMESASEGILISNNQRRITEVNTTACQMLGYSEEELLQLYVEDIINLKSINEVPLRYKELYEGKPIITEREYLRKDGTVFIGETNTKMLKNDVYQAFLRDVTERKNAETQMKAQNEELKKINAELDKFVYRASHDLRAPLVSVLGLINIAKLENNPEVKDSYYDLMIKSINKLDGFIQSIINFSRNSRLETLSVPTDFYSMINDTLEDLKYMQSSHNVQTNITISKGEFYSDPFRLKLIFNNIISNAFKYSLPWREQAFLNIDIRFFENSAELRFIDNGQGIKKESLGRIFEMFYRASDTNAGSGLGLYIVKDVIETLNGKIEVQSDYGVGTTFIITLPNSNRKL